MKPLSLSVVLAAAFASSTVHGSETGPSTPEATLPVIPALYTPPTITSSGHDFIAQCDDEAFAKTRFPQDLAERCERLLRHWRWEASDRGNSIAEAPRIPDYGNALRISHMFPHAPDSR